MGRERIARPAGGTARGPAQACLGGLCKKACNRVQPRTGAYTPYNPVQPRTTPGRRVRTREIFIILKSICRVLTRLSDSRA